MPTNAADWRREALLECAKLQFPLLRWTGTAGVEAECTKRQLKRPHSKSASRVFEARCAGGCGGWTVRKRPRRMEQQKTRPGFRRRRAPQREISDFGFRIADWGAPQAQLPHLSPEQQQASQRDAHQHEGAGLGDRHPGQLHRIELGSVEKTVACFRWCIRPGINAEGG